MKKLNCTENAKIRLTEDVSSEFRDRMIPAGVMGVVVECYKNPEMYAVDLAIPNEELVGGFEYENILLTPTQFEIVER